MSEGKQSVCVFKGSIIDVTYYADKLRELGIESIVKDDFLSGLHAGIPTGAPDLIELLVDMDHAEKAFECIDDLQSSN